MPKISVIIPVYNVEKYLRECLDSVRAQTFRDWECICVDDGSTDGSGGILDEYAKADARFRVIHREHSNAGACRNAGLDVANGEYLLFLDSDDIFSSQMFRLLLKTIEISKTDIASCRIAWFDDGCPKPKLAKYFDCRKAKIFENPGKTCDIYSLWNGRAWDKIFRKAFIDKIGIRFQEIRSTNDARFTFSSLACASRVAMIPSALIAHRKSMTSLEQTRSKDPLCIFSALDLHRQDMCRRNMFSPGNGLEFYFKRWIVSILFWYLDTIDSLSAYKTGVSEFRRRLDDYALDDLGKSDLDFKPGLYDWFDLVRKGSSVEELLWCSLDIAKKKVPLAAQKVRQSLAYRTGKFVEQTLAPVRLIAKLVTGRGI